MRPTCVLDSSALIAYIAQEPGQEVQFVEGLRRVLTTLKEEVDRQEQDWQKAYPKKRKKAI